MWGQVHNEDNIPVRRSIPDVEHALTELRELVSPAEQLDPNVLIELGQFVHSGTPLLATHLDAVSADATGDVIVLYKITDQVQAYLAALRAKARDSSAGKVVGGCNHDASAIPERQASAFPSPMEGKIEAFGIHGVWVPPGLTAAMVMAGADVILAQRGPGWPEFRIGPYSARQLASDVFKAMVAAYEDQAGIGT